MTDHNQTYWAELRARVFSVAIGLTGNHCEAEDLTQEACLRIHENLDSFKGESQFFTWVYSIVRNSYADLCRRDNRQKRIMERVSFQVVPDFSEAYAIRSLLKTLTSLQKKILILREVYGFSYREIARLTSTSIDSVKTRLYRTRKKLADIWKEE